MNPNLRLAQTRPPLHWLSLSVMACLIVVSAVQTWHLIQDARSRTQLAYELAEIDDVRHGLLSAERWLDIGVDLALKRVEVFQITDEHVDILQPLVNDTVDVSIKAFLNYFRKKRSKTYWFVDLILDLEKMRRVLVPVLGPRFVELGADWFNDPANRNEILGIADQQLSALAKDLKPNQDRQWLRDIQSRYDCSSAARCRPVLDGRLTAVESAMSTQQWTIIVSVLLIMLVATCRTRDRSGLLLALCGCVIAWIGGIATPMLDVEARLREIGFTLNDYVALFQDQVLFFHSKSVTDFVRIMMETGEMDMIVVGILIAAFSVVFPILKLVASLIYQWRGPSIRRWSPTNFFALNSSKWSMADVMVVAIFMAYLGLGRLITTQLAQLGASPNTQVISAEGTTLLPGFYLFLTFCIASLWFAILLNKQAVPARES
ncbi:MAG: paraquat-inducible protein A [Myxococcota bacterium]|nr:paraquat-inducible protein A [Myxococcota bacterium]